MADTEKTQPSGAELYRGLATEFLHHYRRGPRYIAVTGVPASNPARVADLLAAALNEAGQPTERKTVADAPTADEFRETTVAPFRSRDDVLVVDGPDLLSKEFRGFWNFSIWLEHDPARTPDWSFVAIEQDQLGTPRESASVMLDDVEPDRPQRLWADYC